MTRSGLARAGAPGASVVVAVTALLCATLPVSSRPSAAAAAVPPEAPGPILSGVVFRDVDHDGRRDPGEPPVSGVTIRGTGTAGDRAGTGVADTTDRAGRYALRGLGPSGRRVRVELASPPRGLYPGPSGRHGAGDVRFLTLVTGPRVDSTATDIGLVDPADYCPSRARVATACQYADEALTRGGRATPAAVQAAAWTGRDRVRGFGSARTLGAVWGLAWQRESKRLLAAAFVKPYSRLGPGGPGAIYAVRAERSSTEVRLLTRLNAGAVPAGAAEQAARVGTTGLGGLDVSADGRQVYVVNLHDRRLYVIPVTNPRGGWPAMAGPAVGYPVPDPGCDSGTARPFAVRAHRTKVYVGVTCDGGRLNGTTGAPRPHRQLTGQVYSFDAEARDFDPTPRLQFSFESPIRCDTASRRPCYWRPWTAEPAAGASAGHDVLLTAHQPWLSDIDFLGDGASDGDMVISIMDRLGHQVPDGAPVPAPRPGRPTEARTRVLPVGGSLRAELRADGSYTFTSTASARFFRDGGLGGLAYRGSDALAAVTAAEKGVAGLVYVRSSDARKVRTNALVAGNATATGARADVLGLSEPELLCDAAPLQIGDRVWRDGDGDGIQDPGEPGIAGVTVSLRDSRGRLVATTRTARDGRYTFADDDVAGGLARYGRYQVSLSRISDFSRRGPLAGTRLAPTGVGEESVDSDAQALRTADLLGRGNLPTVTVTTAGSGRYDHGNDFGIMPPGVRAAPPAVSPADTAAPGRGGGTPFDPVVVTGLSGGVGLIALATILFARSRRRTQPSPGHH